MPLSPFYSQAHDYPFDSIIFRDVRFDTTSVGTTNEMDFFSDVNQSSYIKFQPGLSGFLNALLNNPQVAHHNANNDKLICYIKRFRLTELNSTYQINAKKERQLQIRSTIEALYFYDNKLYPAFRNDTSFLQLLSENKTAYFIIDSLLNAFTKKASKINKEKILKKKSYSEKDVDSIYKQRFNLPILSAASFKKGVYRSSKEFFNNAPSISEYEWKREKNVNILYTKDENNQFIVSQKGVFGFCDGKNIWLKADKSFYPAFRRENTFECNAPLYLKRIVNNNSIPIIVPLSSGFVYITIPSKYSSAYHKDVSVYQLDMETAEFY
jgi:hypothetical protein